MSNDVRLLRKSSDTPTITNIDDARMIRYAYGGDGVVARFGEELNATVNNGVFHISKGLIVIQGWEIEVGDSGWDIDVAVITGTRHYLIYAEVNVAIESAQIKSDFNTGSVPELNVGDDLTAAPNGTARYPLYSFKVTNGAIMEITPLYQVISYTQSEIKDIKSRLDKLGYKEGRIVTLPGITVLNNNNYLKRQGNYVIGRFECEPDTEFPQDENGLAVIGAIPENFIPQNMAGDVQAYAKYDVNGVEHQGIIEVFVLAGGIIKFTVNTCKYLYIIFGYEAKPL